MNGTLQSFFYSYSILLMTLLFLYWGQSLLVPLLLAVALWFLINAVDETLRHLISMPRFISLPLSIAVCFAFLFIVGRIIEGNIQSLIALAPRYAERLTEVKASLSEFLHIKNPPSLEELFEPISFVSVMSQLATLITDLGKNLFIVLIYLLFLFLEQHSFDEKISAAIGDPSKVKKARQVIEDIKKQSLSYMKIKVFISAITGLLTWAVLVLIGVDFAEFWGLVTFFLNFIPNIGSIIATLLISLMALIQFPNWEPLAITSVTLILIHFTMGNIIEPRLLGKSFNLSPLIILLSLALWGYLWGIVGMFLSVPIMVIVSIILSHFESTRSIAIMLSANGIIHRRKI